MIAASPGAAVHGADAAGNYAIWGAGSRSCHQYQVSAADSAARQPFRDYLMGYLTAYNAVAAETYNALGDLNLEQALGWLSEYCDSNKIDSFDRAVTQLILAHFDERSRGVSNAAGAGWGRAPVAQDPGAAARLEEP